MTRINLDALKQKIATFPRKELIHRPTPLRRLDRLSRELGGPEVWIKRDDLTGIAFGGNKSRKLEFIIPDALGQGADTVITWASVQSNWCMQTATAAVRFGLRPILLLFNTSGLTPEIDGNLLLDHILGADVRIRPAEKGKIVGEETVRRAIQPVIDEVKASGRRPYVVSVGGSMPGWSMEKPLGAVAYAAAFVETEEQTRTAGAAITHIVHATGSGATQAGLIVGAKAAKTGIRVVGISVSDRKEEFVPIVQKILDETEKTLGGGLGFDPSDVIVLDDYVKAGYGIIDKETAEAIRLLFATEGVVLDPVYTGKTMAALIDLVKRGYFRKEDRVLFFHTGGTPALFPYREPLIRLLGGEKAR
jgi:D-cysteine desulfhydrase family pyridoxal phosphate-dependent enzyme